jgi:hypothetical protein
MSTPKMARKHHGDEKHHQYCCDNERRPYCIDKSAKAGAIELVVLAREHPPKILPCCGIKKHSDNVEPTLGQTGKLAIADYHAEIDRDVRHGGEPHDQEAWLEPGFGFYR